MANIYWNENEQCWRCHIQIDGVEKNFKSRKAGNAGKREIQNKIRQFKSLGEYKDVTFEQEWQLFLEDVLSRSSQANWKNIQQIGRLYVLPEIGKRKMSALRLSELQRLINNSRKADGTALSFKSLANIKCALSAFINYARIDGATDLIPQGLYVPKNAQKGVKNILTVEQVRAIFSGFEDEFYINLWRLMLCTGMRPGEALGLQWNDIDGFYIKIRRAINRDREITDCKNANARRAIPINSLIGEILDSQKKKTQHIGSEWIFPSPSGEMPSQSTASKSIKRISKELGTDVSPYCLRHTFVSILKNDIPEAYMKQIIGHSTSMPTYHGTYAHDLTGEREKASLLIDDSLRKLI